MSRCHNSKQLRHAVDQAYTHTHAPLTLSCCPLLLPGVVWFPCVPLQPNRTAAAATEFLLLLLPLQWCAIERAPRQYVWTGYKQLFEMVRACGLKLQVVLSFHACGGNVGDMVQVPLPAWVLQVGGCVVWYGVERVGSSKGHAFTAAPATGCADNWNKLGQPPTMSF